MQTATSTGSLVAYGLVGYWPDPRGGDLWFTAVFADPGAGAVGTGPTGGEADLRRPWASLAEQHWGAGEVGNGSVLCGPLTNPSDHQAARDSQGLLHVSFQTQCDDGRGYDYYRVTWDAEQNWNPLWDANTWWWGSHKEGEYRGSFTLAITTFQSSQVQVCGVKGAQIDCFVGSGRVYPDAQRLVVEARSTGI